MKKNVLTTAAMCAAIVGMVTGCFTSARARTETRHPDGRVTLSEVSIVGTGDKASDIAAEGLFADGSESDLGAGAETAKAKQQSTGVEGAITALSQFTASLGVFAQSIQSGGQTSGYGVGVQAGTAPAAAAVSTPRLSSMAASGVLSGKVAEAKANRKTLVVVAGSPQCGYCTRFDESLNASALPTRADIVLVKEIVPWESNSALDWTGGGDAPIVRVTSWKADGSIACDTKLNRPSVAEVEAAITACVAK